MVLTILDRAGVYATAPDERDIDVQFANPLDDEE
jgi:hypothetical protein